MRKSDTSSRVLQAPSVTDPVSLPEIFQEASQKVPDAELSGSAQ